MPTSPSKQSRKRVCLCTSSGCGRKFHPDLNGILQPGLELSENTIIRHNRADRNARAAAQLSINRDSERLTSSINHDPRTSIAQNEPPSPTLGTNDNHQPSPIPAEGTAVRRTVVVEEATDRTHRDQDLRGDDLSVGPGERDSTSATLPAYDCGRFYSTAISTSHPLILHTVLTVCMLSVLEQNSQRTMSWLLQSIVSGFLLALDGPLSPTIQLAISKLPRDIRTATRWLMINPKIATMTCCPRCFTLYQVDETPLSCTQQKATGHLGRTGDNRSLELEEDQDSDNINYPADTQDFCAEALFKGRSSSVPIRTYAFQDLEDWIARLLSRPDIEDLLDETLIPSRKPYGSNLPVSDIQGSRIWKELLGPDGKQFTASSGNLTFGMFNDAINPYGNKQSGKHASITFYVLVCLTLPWNIRHLPENIFLAGIAPGPDEPKIDQVNSMLRPLVNQLLRLWHHGVRLSRTYRHPEGRLVRAALLTFVADLVALRRTLGFPGITSKIMCSFCFLSSSEKSNFNPESWPRRCLEEHRKWSIIARDSASPKERDNIMKEHGLRYCVLIELPYWDIIHYHVVDSMHNLLLGLLHWHCRHAWSMEDVDDPDDEEDGKTAGRIPRTEVEDIQADMTRIWNTPYLPASWNWEDDGDANQNGSEPGFLDLLFGSSSSTSDDDFEPPEKPLDGGWAGKWVAPPLDKIIFDSIVLTHINQMLPRIHLPSWIKRGISRLGKVSFGSLKADKWRTLFTVQLVLILVPLWGRGDQEKESLLQNFGHLVSLVNLALKRIMTKQRVEDYTVQLRQYLEGVIILFGHVELRPNHHMAFHLAESLERSGPVRAWWSFPFERLMGTILKGCHNNRLGELEITFLKGFCQGGNLRALLESNRLPPGLKPFLPKLQALYDPPVFVARDADSTHRLEELSVEIHGLLVDTLNSPRWQAIQQVRWLSSSQWARLDLVHQANSRPVSSQVEVKTSFYREGAKFSNVNAYPKDSVVSLWVDTPQGQVERYGEILGIFKHTRRHVESDPVTSDYVHIDIFREVPFAKGTHFKD